MRITTVTGLAIAGAALAAAMGFGTAAYADGHGETLIITTTDDGTGTAATEADRAPARWDCPGNDGTGTSPSTGPSDTTAGTL